MIAFVHLPIMLGQNPTKFVEWLICTSGAYKSTFIYFWPYPQGGPSGVVKSCQCQDLLMARHELRSSSLFLSLLYNPDVKLLILYY